MAEHGDLGYIEELFRTYVAHLNQEFHDSEAVRFAHDESVAIASDLLELGYQVLTRVNQSSSTIRLADNTVQTIITFEYDIMLVKHEIPIQDPIAVAGATSRVYGPTTVPTGKEHIQPAISADDEEWFNRQIEGLKL